MLQNSHPRVKPYLLFANRPESIEDLFSLATTVAEAVAVEDQRKRATATAQRPPAGREWYGFRPDIFGQSLFKCWGCGAPGHMLRLSI
jgi:hypothetical protein